jgi:hypothetical protein
MKMREGLRMFDLALVLLSRVRSAINTTIGREASSPNQGPACDQA